MVASAPVTILGHRLRQRSGSVCQQSTNGGWVDSGRLVGQKVASSVLVTILRHRLRPRSGSGCQQPRMVDGSTTSHLPHLNRGRVSSGLQAVLPRRGRWVVVRVGEGAGLGVLHTWATRAVGDIGSRARLRPGCVPVHGSSVVGKCVAQEVKFVERERQDRGLWFLASGSVAQDCKTCARPQSTIGRCPAAQCAFETMLGVGGWD